MKRVKNRATEVLGHERSWFASRDVASDGGFGSWRWKISPLENLPAGRGVMKGRDEGRPVLHRQLMRWQDLKSRPTLMVLSKRQCVKLRPQLGCLDR